MSEEVKVAEPKQKIQVDLEVDTSVKDWVSIHTQN